VSNIYAVKIAAFPKTWQNQAPIIPDRRKKIRSIVSLPDDARGDFGLLARSARLTNLYDVPG